MHCKSHPCPLRVVPTSTEILQGHEQEGPSYGTVFSIVRDFRADRVTLAHEGTKAYSNTFALVHRREAMGPNATCQADHTPLDILLIRPDGETGKPWLSTLIDDNSRAVALGSSRADSRNQRPADSDRRGG